MEGKVLGGGGDEASAMPAVYPHGKVSVSSLGSFLSVGSSYKPSHPSLIISLGVHRIQGYFKKKRGGKKKHIKPQEEKDRHKEKRKQMRVTVQAKLVVGY